jgi:hypothetical protein
MGDRHWGAPPHHARPAPTSIPAACRLTAANGGKSRLGATLWLLTVGHRCLHDQRGDRQWPWGRERRRCSPLPHGIRALPVTTDVATGSRDHPQQRAHRTIVPTASHGPLPWREYTAGCALVPSRGTAAPRHKHPHKGSALEVLSYPKHVHCYRRGWKLCEEVGVRGNP